MEITGIILLAVLVVAVVYAIMIYNQLVQVKHNINNVRIEQFPDSIIAALFSFKPMELLEFSAPETADVDVKQLFQA